MRLYPLAFGCIPSVENIPVGGAKSYVITELFNTNGLAPPRVWKYPSKSATATLSLPSAATAPVIAALTVALATSNS